MSCLRVPVVHLLRTLLPQPLKPAPLIAHVRVDERSAAFTALGIAKASGQPVGLVCTSGTALGEYMPAVMEAYHAGVPLAVLSADRPERLRGSGVNQTTRQASFFHPLCVLKLI